MKKIRFTRERVDNQAEKNLIVALIVDTNFCKSIEPLYKSEYLQGEVSGVVATWCLEYFRDHGEAPGEQIQKIYEVRRYDLTKSQVTLVEDFLEDLSNDYLVDKINPEYVLQQTVKYFKKRSIDTLADRIKFLVANDQISEAEQAVLDFHKVERVASQWTYIFSDKAIIEAYNSDDRDRLFGFHGELGTLIDTPFCRGWLIAFLGPPKRGKTTWLSELALEACLNRLNVAFFSLEMSQAKSAMRMYRRITGWADPKKDLTEFVYPVFDCTRNRDGVCKSKKRENKSSGSVVDVNGELIPYSPEVDYTVCTYCRDNDDGVVLKVNFSPCVWFRSLKRDKMNLKKLREQGKKFRTAYGNTFVFTEYPAHSANLSDIQRDLDAMEIVDGFQPDVIIVDYADILQPERVSYRATERGIIDVTWKTLKRMASERRCLVATASQTNRDSIDKKNVGQKDIAEDIRKINHVDAAFTINQTKEEKAAGITRIGVTAVRDDDYYEHDKVTVLQHLKTGQVHIDSARIIEEEKDTKSDY